MQLMPTKENYIAFFLDFQKAFDSVWHNGLLYKLLDNKIAGKSYYFLADVYSRSKCPVKLGYKRTDCFNYNKGIRQGCILSPLLFNLSNLVYRRQCRPIYRSIKRSIVGRHSVGKAVDSRSKLPKIKQAIIDYFKKDQMLR